MRAGRSKMAKKLAEEAIEVVIDAMNGDREAVVRESADLLYNLVVLWAEAGVRPQHVFAEMARRERLFGLAEKLPKKHVETSARRKVTTASGSYPAFRTRVRMHVPLCGRTRQGHEGRLPPAYPGYGSTPQE